MSVYRCSYGEALVGDGEAFSVERTLPEVLGLHGLLVHAAAVHQVVRASWRHKFVPDVLSETALDAKLGNIEDQLRRIQSPSRHGRYWLAYQPENLLDPQLRSPEQTSAILRVGTYKPRKPFAKSYPSVTDLETRNGQLRGKYEKQAAALLYVALADYNQKPKTAAYTEKPNADGVSFFENLGYRQTGNTPVEVIGPYVMTYVHIEAESVQSVRSQLVSQYPWLEGDL